MPSHSSITGKALHKGKGGTSGRHGAANQGVKAGSGGKKGRAVNPAASKVSQKNAQGGGPGGGK